MKSINIADLHFGNSNNSVSHNEAMLDFFVWLIEWRDMNYPEIREINVLGDVFHQRDKLSVDTINYAHRGMSLLGDFFDKVRIVVGNHDMFQRDSVDVHSCIIFSGIKNVEIIDDIIIRGDILYTPWIVNQEHYSDLIKLTKERKIKYIFGHFEFSTFRLNDNYVMEHGQTHNELKHLDKVFTGHYHGRQEVDNVTYVGNPFPYDFNDANDPNKGMMIFDSETGEHYFKDYDKITVSSVTYDELKELSLSDVDEDFSNDSLRVVVENDITEEALDEIKEFLDSHNFRSTKLVYKRSIPKKVIEEEGTVELDHLMSVDEAVISHIKGIEESDLIKKDLLLELYDEVILET